MRIKGEKAIGNSRWVSMVTKSRWLTQIVDHHEIFMIICYNHVMNGISLQNKQGKNSITYPGKTFPVFTRFELG